MKTRRGSCNALNGTHYGPETPVDYAWERILQGRQKRRFLYLVSLENEKRAHHREVSNMILNELTNDDAIEAAVEEAEQKAPSVSP
jgi:hypothetical protein